MNLETRITIPEIMENRWFKKGFKHIKFYIEDELLCNIVEEEEEEDDDSVSDQSESESEPGFEMTRSLIRRKGALPRPASLNAFEGGVFR